MIIPRFSAEAEMGNSVLWNTMSFTAGGEAATSSKEEYMKHDGAVCYSIFMETAFFRTLAEARVQIIVPRKP